MERRRFCFESQQAYTVQRNFSLLLSILHAPLQADVEANYKVLVDQDVSKSGGVLGKVKVGPVGTMVTLDRASGVDITTAGNTIGTASTYADLTFETTTIELKVGARVSRSLSTQ